MKKHRWLVPLCWFGIPTIALTVIRSFGSLSNIPSFMGIAQYLFLFGNDMAQSPLHMWRFILNTAILALPAIFATALMGGVFYLIVRKSRLSVPVRYGILFACASFLWFLLLFVWSVRNYLPIIGQWGFAAFLDLMSELGLLTPDCHIPTVLQYGVASCFVYWLLSVMSSHRAAKKAARKAQKEEDLSFTSPE